MYLFFSISANWKKIPKGGVFKKRKIKKIFWMKKNSPSLFYLVNPKKT